MLKTVLKFSLASMLLIFSQACTLGATTPSPNTVNTAIAQTMAVLTQTPQPGVPITGGESPTPTTTSTATLPPTAAPTSAFTATAAVPQVSVYVATNCRTGPSTAYPRIGGLQIGQVADVVGRNATNTYWIIRNPSAPNQLCWLWGQFATLTGNTGALPVFTPPPPPPPTAAPTATITLTPAATSTSASPTVSPTPTATSTP